MLALSACPERSRRKVEARNYGFSRVLSSQRAPTVVMGGQYLNLFKISFSWLSGRCRNKSGKARFWNKQTELKRKTSGPEGRKLCSPRC
jgi:hypothetical protein